MALIVTFMGLFIGGGVPSVAKLFVMNEMRVRRQEGRVNKMRDGKRKVNAKGIRMISMQHINHECVI